ERGRDGLGGERPLGQVQQRVNLADRAIDPPLPAHVAPMQDEAFDRARELDILFGNFCHDRNIRTKEMNVKVEKPRRLKGGPPPPGPEPAGHRLGPPARPKIPTQMSLLPPRSGNP